MADIAFKKELKNGLYNYLHVSNPYADAAMPDAETAGVLYNGRFHHYISLAVFLTPHLKNYVLAKSSPFLMQHPFVQNAEAISWTYEVLADDYYGLGVDKDFINLGEHGEQPFLLFYTDDLLPLACLPEDTFGDKVSYCSIFSLKNNRHGHLKKFMQATAPPDVAAILQEGELFSTLIAARKPAISIRCWLNPVKTLSHR